jgi:hypothetical protein
MAQRGESATGVRPSPGAARSIKRTAFDITNPSPLSDIAAPGDGRTPNHKRSRHPINEATKARFKLVDGAVG